MNKKLRDELIGVLRSVSSSSSRRIELSTLQSLSEPPFEQMQFSVEDVKSVLGQRVPDSVGEKKIPLRPNVSTCAKKSVTLSVFEAGEGACELENTTSGELHFVAVR